MYGSQLNIMTSCGCIWRSDSLERLEERTSPSAGQGASAAEESYFPSKSLLIVNVMSNGQLWRWRASLPCRSPDVIREPSADLIDFAAWNGDSVADTLLDELGQPTALGNGTSDKEKLPKKISTSYEEDFSERLDIERVLCTLSGSVTHVSVLPLCLSDGKALAEEENAPSPIERATSLDIVSEEIPEETPRILLPDSCRSSTATVPESHTRRTRTPILAAVTATGGLEIIALRRGCLTAVYPEIIRSYSVHESRCRSVRWLGNGPLAVSFSSEKIDGLWKNILMLTDVRTGESVPFRVMPPETSGMLGIRASPAGKYVVVLLKDAPSEIWLVSTGEIPLSVNRVCAGNEHASRKEGATSGDPIHGSGLDASARHITTIPTEQKLVSQEVTSKTRLRALVLTGKKTRDRLMNCLWRLLSLR